VEHKNDYFHHIVTRPGMLRDAPSKKWLTALRSLPGPVPVTNVDLAKFSLGALMEHKLYDTTPYVIGDGELKHVYRGSNFVCVVVTTHCFGIVTETEYLYCSISLLLYFVLY
jgi:hypothetical protein